MVLRRFVICLAGILALPGCGIRQAEEDQTRIDRQLVREQQQMEEVNKELQDLKKDTDF